MVWEKKWGDCERGKRQTSCRRDAELPPQKKREAFMGWELKAMMVRKKGHAGAASHKTERGENKASFPSIRNLKPTGKKVRQEANREQGGENKFHFAEGKKGVLKKGSRSCSGRQCAPVSQKWFRRRKQARSFRKG